jgi:hypothetical protein
MCRGRSAPVGANDLVIDLEAALARPRHREPRVILTGDEEREIELYGFKSRLPIHITRKREPRRPSVRVECSLQDVRHRDVAPRDRLDDVGCYVEATALSPV